MRLRGEDGGATGLDLETVDGDVATVVLPLESLLLLLLVLLPLLLVNAVAVVLAVMVVTAVMARWS